MLNPPYAYPPAHQEQIYDDYHGTRVYDPYRWLEDPASPGSRSWTQAQNELCQSYLQPELQAQILQRLESLCNYSRWSTPFKMGNRYFFWRHEGLQNQPVLYWQKRFTEEPRPLLNPNTLSKQGVVSVMNAEPSRNGEYLAYSLSQRGSDWQEIRIRNVDTGEDFNEVLQHTKFSGIAWHPEHTGFYYNRYPDPATVQDANLSYYNAVYWHELGTDQAEDILVYERPDQKDFDFWPQVTHAGDFLVLTAYLGTDRRNRVYYRPLNSEGEFVRLLDDANAHYRFLGNQHGLFYFYTDHNAPQGKVIAIDIARPEEAAWQEVVPEEADTLTHAIMAGHHLMLVYLHHAHHRLFSHDLKSSERKEIALPTLGSITELHGKPHDDEVFIGFSSFLFPARSYMYHLKALDLDEIFTSDLNFNAEDYTTRQIFATSKDGTQVPMFLVHHKDLQPSAETPVLMYGYGGFRQALTPSFSATLLPWLEQGGIYCLVNTRGGSEYGTAWYQAGTLERKQNVFDDFIAAGEHLIAQGLTSSAKLVIRGGSNGGLLVAACMLQRPELFGAVVCQVPVLDMLRYHRFTIGRYWVSDYGNAEENPEHFTFLKAYSPLHNVKPGQAYPPLLITSADHDDRVVPSHAKKFAATLQSLADGQNLVLLRVETDAGHGRGKPLSKSLQESADIYAFLAQSLNMNWLLPTAQSSV